MKIYRLATYCGSYGKPKGHLDTQMFPECENKPGDRDVVKKTRKRKKKKKKASHEHYHNVCPSCGDEEYCRCKTRIEATSNLCHICKKTAKKTPKNETPYNPYAVCTESIGKTEGTTERSEWSQDAKDRYDRCIQHIKDQNVKSKKDKKKKACSICSRKSGEC